MSCSGVSASPNLFRGAGPSIATACSARLPAFCWKLSSDDVSCYVADVLFMYSFTSKGNEASDYW